MDDGIVELIRTIAPGVKCDKTTESMRGGTVETITLPPAAGSDYAFELSTYGGEGSIAAKLVEAPNEFFWYKMFEAADYRGDLERLNRDFISAVETILTRETFVLQKKGLLWSTFRLAYRVKGQGRVLSFVAAPRFLYRAPRIAGRKHYYRSFPLGKNRSDDPEPQIENHGFTILLFDGGKR